MILGRRVKSRYKFILSRAWANDAVSSTWLRADKGRKKAESRIKKTRDEKRARKPAKRHARLETIIYIK